MANNEIRLRPAQQEIMRYQSGKMGIAAVPGSGKTWTLSYLAAQIVASGVLGEGQEVLVVTLVNSAVDNFYHRVSRFVGSQGLLTNMGYRVRTLHGLANDIVRARPGLVGLEDRFEIVDEGEAKSILNEAAAAWLKGHGDILDAYLNPDLNPVQLASLQNQQKLSGLVQEAAAAVIAYAKDQRISPERLAARLEDLPVPLPLAQMGVDIYADYQRALRYRGAVDFDDLIRLAVEALDSDPSFLQRLRSQWPYILEDEAQDSSRLQEEILTRLVGENGNWVRVGDPNQAIYESFTTANPRYLREFMRAADVQAQALPNSGRSNASIIRLANRLVRWSMDEHPVEAVRDALSAPPWIEPAPSDDPDPNPPDAPNVIYLSVKPYTPQEEIEAVAVSLARWLPDHPDQTVAVLSAQNNHLENLAQELIRRKIPFNDSLLRTTSATRQTAQVLRDVVNGLANPHNRSKLIGMFKAWQWQALADSSTKAGVERSVAALRNLEWVEDYLWPGPDRDFLADLEMRGADEQVLALLSDFQVVARRWQSAAALPIDQLILTLAQDLLSQPADLALAHKLANLLRSVAQANPHHQLPDLSRELDVIAQNQRKYLGFTDGEQGFQPEAYAGQAVLCTYHRAKGLEWDRVYLMSVNNYDFPSAQPGDAYRDERWYLRDQLNLIAEATAQLKAALDTSEYAWYEEGQGGLEARLDYTRERLRLLYVGLTRAKRELVMTTNTGRYTTAGPALPLLRLAEIWNQEHADD